MPMCKSFVFHRTAHCGTSYSVFPCYANGYDMLWLDDRTVIARTVEYDENIIERTENHRDATEDEIKLYLKYERLSKI